MKTTSINNYAFEKFTLCKFVEVNRNGEVKRRGKFYQPFLNEKGYAFVSLDKKVIPLHRLIWNVFVGEIPIGKVINHKDLNKQNNSLSNLECISNSENVQHYQRIYRKKQMIFTVKRLIEDYPEFKHELIIALVDGK